MTAKLCACGCGQPVSKPTNKFLRGHSGAKLTSATARAARPPTWTELAAEQRRKEVAVELERINALTRG